MTNYYEKNRHVLISGTLVAPDKIQYIKNNEIVIQSLDFSKLYSMGKGSETAFYDVLVTGKRVENKILVDEILDSPEETKESIYRLGDHNIIKWVFVSESDFYDPVKIDSVKKTIGLLGENKIIEIEGIGRVRTINTTVDYYDHRYSHIFINTNDHLTVAGSEDYMVRFDSFQLGVDHFYK